MSLGWESSPAQLFSHYPKEKPTSTFLSFFHSFFFQRFFFNFNGWLTVVSFPFDSFSFFSYNAKYSIANSFLSCYMSCWLAAVADSGCFRGRGGKNFLKRASAVSQCTGKSWYIYTEEKAVYHFFSTGEASRMAICPPAGKGAFHLASCRYISQRRVREWERKSVIMTKHNVN